MYKGRNCYVGRLESKSLRLTIVVGNFMEKLHLRIENVVVRKVGCRDVN
jgi:hypothetical protein